MCKLIAAICFLLALFGYDSRDNGTTAAPPPTDTALHSKTRIIAGLIDRECPTSASNSCYYVLLPCDCAADPTGGKHDGWRVKLRTPIASN